MACMTTTQSGFMQDDRIYEALKNDDLSEVVLLIFNLFKENHILFQPSEEKSENQSNHYRSLGNKAYVKAEYRTALENYNRALQYAPKGSSALALAYSNRSALLFHLKLYKECLEDIERSLALDLPYNVIDKLMTRKRDAIVYIDVGLNLGDHYMAKLCAELLDYKRKNPDVPCASTDINFTVVSGKPKVVTAKTVKIGTTLAVEQAYVSTVKEEYKLISCHYCQNVNTNMIPCEDCCTVLFCNDTCRKLCIAEYHSVICKGYTPIDTSTDDMTCYIKAAVKARKSFKSWKEFNEVSLLLGRERIKISDKRQIFNVANKFSILNFAKDLHFTHGRIYNCALEFAQIIYCIVQKGNFFPEQTDDKINAIRSFSRVLMYIGMNVSLVDAFSCVANITLKQNHLNFTCSGIYPLIGKLKHSCNPNVLAIGLNNRMVLLAIKPMAPGTELNISYAGHWLDYNIPARQEMLLIKHFIICSCHICKGITLTNQKRPSEAQIQMYNKLNPIEAARALNFNNFIDIYNSSIDVLTQLNDFIFSEEYKSVYDLFRKCILNMQHFVCPNKQI